MAVTTAKLVAVALLGAVAMVLASAAIALSLILRQKKSPNYGRIKVQRGGGGGPNAQHRGRGGNNALGPTYQPPFDPTRDLPAHRRQAPDPTSSRRAGDVHLSHAIRLATGNPFGDVLPHGDSGVDDYYSYEGNPDLEWMMRTGNAGASASGSFTSGAGRGGSGGGLASLMGGGGNSVARVLLSPLVLLDGAIAKLVGGEGIGGAWRSPGSGGRRRKKGSSGRGATKVGGAGGGYGGTNDTEAFWHLTQSAELGNPHAQYWLGNALASGVFAGRGRDGAVAEDGVAPVVPDDLGAGGSDLGRALTLWHMAAMGGVMEAQMALGYRYNAALKASGGGGGNTAAGGGGKRNRKDKAIGGADVSYGVPGDCMAAMAYYEEAANAAMDEMEASPLRGKVTPATDRHRLSEIHMHGASSALAHHNKPDELEEALEYLRIRATHAHDAHSAFTLANLHHYGLRGVSQDMRLALKYYEMAATANFDPDFPLSTSHPEAAGQVAKIYFLGMGVEPDPVEAYRFMRMGAPGGWKNCSVGGGEEEGDDGEELVECDAEALNCLGLAHLLGIEGLVDVNQKRAVRYFSLARDLGSYDAVYHLAMMRMGWMNNVVEDEDVEEEGVSKEEVLTDAKKKKEQLDEMFEEVSNEVAAALEAAGEQGQDPATLARVAAAALGRVDRLEAMRESMDGMDEEVTIQLEQVIKKGDDTSEAAGSEESDTAGDAASTGSEGGDGGSSVAAKSAPKQELKIRHIQLKPPTESVDQKERYGKVDYTRALNEFVRAGSKGHIQSIHRAGVMYARGIGTGVNCPKAVQYLRQVAESSPGIGRRLRLAYRSYKSGKVDLSLRNYLAAAEAGIELAQSNAAWLLERGYCLGLDKRGCVNASLRMWRAASRQGNAEASLRVGDFHYYGRLNQNDVTESGWDWPFLISYLTHPSIWVRRARAYTISLVRKGLKITRKRSPRNQRKAPQGVEDDVVDITPSSPTSATSPSGDASKEPQACPAGDDTCKAARSLTADGDSHSKQTLQERNFHMAAQYYRKAVEANSPRASFNLGFMYEWGLGLKQDFPLAKRYYDSAASNHREAALAVNIALTSMNFHEKMVKMRQNYKEKWGDKGVWEVATEKLQEAVFGEEIGALLSSNENSREILTSHLWSFETCLIVVLVIVLALLVRHHIASRARVIELQVQR